METKINFDINNLIRDNIKKLKPYQSAREQFSESGCILLDANENPFPIGYNRYPDPLQKELKTEIAKLKDTNVENIFLGNGSDEIIDLLFRAFCNPGVDSVLVNTPTYGMYKVCAGINDVGIIKVELDDEFQIDLDAVYSKMNEAKLIFICSPNNPTGNIIKRKAIIDILNSFNGLVIVDEAYNDFSEEKSFIKELNNYPNLVVLQTFSKARAMAGIRLGMGFASSQIVDILTKIKYPYNINQLSQSTALKALQENSNLAKTVKAIITQRESLITELYKLGQVQKIWPSDANFILIKFKDHLNIFEYLKNSGIIIRDRSKEPKCKGCLRISIGTSQENTKLIEALHLFEKL